jgi:hypothetical protein
MLPQLNKFINIDILEFVGIWLPGINMAAYLAAASKGRFLKLH